MEKSKPIFRVIIGEFEKDEDGKKTNKYKTKEVKINGKIKKIELKGGVVLDRLNEALGYNYNESYYDSDGNRLPEFMQYNWLDRSGNSE